MDYVTLKELAAEWGLDRSNTRKYVLKSGFTPVSIRDASSRGQLTLALPREEAEAVRRHRERQGFGASPRPITNGRGFFYILQVMPDVDPNRLKLGFASDMKGRLEAHRCVSPTAICLRTWHCERVWEAAAIASATRAGCRLIANEVYHCESPDQVVEQADQFFAVMPA